MHKNADVGIICDPGPAGDALTQNGVSELSLVAGRWVPASIVAIRRTRGNSAIADVRMSFELSQIFQDFENAFEEIQIVRMTFQRYGNGWHVESVD
jgi:hypothetical protein